MNESDKLSTEVVNAIQSGQKIQAIKLLREERNLGLKEAKDLVDAHVARQPNDVVQRRASAGPGAFVVVVIVITAAFAAYVYLA